MEKTEAHMEKQVVEDIKAKGIGGADVADAAGGATGGASSLAASPVSISTVVAAADPRKKELPDFEETPISDEPGSNALISDTSRSNAPGSDAPVEEALMEDAPLDDAPMEDATCWL
jgi:hypothetical protein